MSNGLHVVLGASGSIGQAVISELKARDIEFKAVERKKYIPGVETRHADLLDLEQAIEAIKGASHVYLCIGILYNAKVWAEQWPKVAYNVIEACEKVNAKLIFFDNIYMYGPTPLRVPFDEAHPQNPVSKKGMVRKRVADLIMEAHNSGRIKAVIGRSPDFYGPKAEHGSFYAGLLDRMLVGKAPLSISGTDIKHTYAYVPDMGRALVALALDDGTYGQVWHLPVSEPITINEVVSKINCILDTNYKATVIPRALFSMIGIFMPIMKEVKEMMYQFDNTYIMNFDKFKNHFPDFKITPIDEGIEAMVRSFQMK